MQPTGTVFAVAFLGVAGTLGAAVFTQVWSAAGGSPMAPGALPAEDPT